MLIHVGTNEVLLDDSRNLALEMDKQGVDVDIDIYEGMWHVWHMYDVPEARAAINKMVWFLQTALELDGMKKRTVRPGARYRHFKGKDYRVLYVARHSETLEEMVVYQQLYGDQGIWVRPLEMFLETVEQMCIRDSSAWLQGAFLLPRSRLEKRRATPAVQGMGEEPGKDRNRYEDV